MSTLRRHDRRLPTFALIGTLACGVLATLSRPAPAQDRLANNTPTVAASELAQERDRHFAEATALAERDEWAAAAAAAQVALALAARDDPHYETELSRSILQYLAVWQQLDSDYTGAVATHRLLLESCSRALGPRHWLKLATQIDLDDCQRDAQRSRADQQRLAAGNQLEMQALRLQAAGKYELARAAATQALAIREPIVQREEGGVAECLNSIGVAYLWLAQHKEALPFLERSAAIRMGVYGLENPGTLSTLQSLAVVGMYLRDYARTGELLETIVAGYTSIYGVENPTTLVATLELAAFHMMRDNVEQARPLMEAVLEKQLATLGATNFDVARSRMRLGQLYAKTGDPRAAQFLQDSADLFRALDAANTADFARTLATLGVLQYTHNQYQLAEPTCLEALDVFAKTVGHHDPAAIDVMACLARTYKSQGDYGRAERLLRQSVDLYIQFYGEENEHTAKALKELGGYYQHLNLTDRAQVCLDRALKIYLVIHGEGHVETIMTMLSRAGQHVTAARLDEAERQMTAALAVAKKHLGADHEAAHAALYMLGNLYYVQRNYDKCEETLRTLWTGRVAKHPDEEYANAVVLQSLVAVLIKQGEYKQAAEYAQQVLEVAARELPEFHSGWTEVLRDMAMVSLALGRCEDAERFSQRAIENYRHAHHAASLAQSEQQQLKMSFQQRGALHLFLSVPQSAVTAEEAYAQVLLWKGSIHARQARERGRRGADLAPLAAEVQSLATQVATLSLQVPEPSARESWIAELRTLRDRQVTLDSQLAHATREASSAEEVIVTPDQVRAALPSGVVLVDLYIHSHHNFTDAEGQPQLERALRLNAFVVRADRPVERIDLGPLEPIEAEVDAWRAKGLYTSDSSKEASAVTLRQLIWEPIESKLDGCTTIVFSPDGRLARFPLGVLPGRAPGSFLLEDVSIAVIAVPQLLPELLSTPAAEALGATDAPSLLLIGDVDYDAGASAKTAPAEENTEAQADDEAENSAKVEGEITSGELVTFAPLKSTGPETDALAKMYREHFPQGCVTLLQQAAATESAFRREAPLHRWLLVATHGFYAPQGISSALTALNRPRDLAGADGTEEYYGSLSGLALAGANLGVAHDTDDGILTTAEVSNLDLRSLDLAVLSGCETALGAVSDGEGSLGLDRAFQLAGVRTTVSSLWTVPDGKTSLLMQRFHKNLWEKKLSKLEALREAQLWMLRTGGKEPSSEQPKGAAVKRAAPYYWAAFVLSGDWR